VDVGSGRSTRSYRLIRHVLRERALPKLGDAYEALRRPAGRGSHESDHGADAVGEDGHPLRDAQPFRWSCPPRITSTPRRYPICRVPFAALLV